VGDLTRTGLLASWPRLIGIVWTLARADALLPREAEGAYSPPIRALGRVLRIASGPSARRGRPGQRLALALGGLGPGAIKFGQFLSTRADIFGQTFADDIGHLKDRLPPFPTAAAREEIEAGLGRPMAEVFVNFDDAIAAASLAQVHRAQLTDGRSVAIKVLRPGIERRVEADIRTLSLAARIVEAWPVARRLAPGEAAAALARTLRLELDLRFEAAGADELRAVIDKDGYMGAPKVVWEGVAKRVLTLEWASGMPLSDCASLEQPGIDRKRLAQNLIRAFLAQALDHGVFHADLHEGNLFVSAPASITVVDFGIIGRLGSVERRYLAEILWGFLRRDYTRLAEVHFEAGYVHASHDRGAFAQALRGVGEPMFGRPANEVSMERLLTQLFQITDLFEMRLRPELILLQKTMVTAEGVARRIDPGCDIWGAAEPIVRRWIVLELSPAARLRSAANDAKAALKGFARLAANAEPPQAEEQAPVHITSEPVAALLGFGIGALAAAIAFAAAAWLH
jgi:ubiquinone biosynthesis protein